MYIVTFERFIETIGKWHSGAETFRSLESAVNCMAYSLKRGGAYYRNVKLWTAEEVGYKVDIIVE